MARKILGGLYLLLGLYVLVIYAMPLFSGHMLTDRGYEGFAAIFTVLGIVYSLFLLVAAWIGLRPQIRTMNWIERSFFFLPIALPFMLFIALPLVGIVGSLALHPH